MSKVKVPSVSQWLTEWQGHLLSCCGQLKSFTARRQSPFRLLLKCKSQRVVFEFAPDRYCLFGSRRQYWETSRHQSLASPLWLKSDKWRVYFFLQYYFLCIEFLWPQKSLWKPVVMLIERTTDTARLLCWSSQPYCLIGNLHFAERHFQFGWFSDVWKNYK